MKYVIFDDSRQENFLPLTFTRAVFDLRIGILKQRNRIAAYLGEEIKDYIVWDSLESLYQTRHPEWRVNSLTGEDTVFVNSRIRIDANITATIKSIEIGSCLVSGEEIIAARFIPETEYINSLEIEKLFKERKFRQVEGIHCWSYLWEIVSENSESIEKDFEDFFQEKDNQFETELGVTVINPYNIWIGEQAEIKPGVVIDAGKGPVVIDEGTRIMSNSVIEGPVYIGRNSLVRAMARIYPGTSIGPVCKVGGEVEGTIFQAYSNKQHDGFLGHSYLGEWINIGAGTNNSDLKNNYNPVAVYSYPEGEKINTNQKFVGCFIGDHTKIGINCSLNTGVVIGTGCNLYGRSLIRSFVPSYSWGEYGSYSDYKLDNFHKTAEVVKKRRSLVLSDQEKELFAEIKTIEQQRE